MCGFTPNQGGASCRRAFSLVELLIVVLILSILGAIVLPRYAGGTTDARAAAIMSNLRVMQQGIQQYEALHGITPDTILAGWFVESEPEHPENDFGAPAVQVLDSPGLPHPASKVLKSGISGAYWYNPSEGVVRARVADQGSSAATLDFYNRVNKSGEAALGNYGGGGGGS